MFIFTLIRFLAVEPSRRSTFLIHIVFRIIISVTLIIISWLHIITALLVIKLIYSTLLFTITFRQFVVDIISVPLFTDSNNKLKVMCI